MVNKQSAVYEEQEATQLKIYKSYSSKLQHLYKLIILS